VTQVEKRESGKAFQLERDSVHTPDGNHYRQPIEAANVPDALLTVGVVSAIVGLAPRTIRDKVANGTFPKPAIRTRRMVRWRADVVHAWLAQCQPVAV
jgi:predicted DNA-binding transcriptional regulator AlpA